MSSEFSRTHVYLHAGELRTALPISCIRSLSSWRRARIHAIRVSHGAIVGVLERAGRCSTVVDLGLLLSGVATASSPASRLVTVETPSGLLTLLADRISEPLEVAAAPSPPSEESRLFAGTVSDGGGEMVPLLDLAAVLQALAEERSDA